MDKKAPKKWEREPQYRKKEVKKAPQQSDPEQPFFPSFENNANTSWSYQPPQTDAIESKNKTDDTLLFGEPLKSSAAPMTASATTEATITGKTSEPARKEEIPTISFTSTTTKKNLFESDAEAMDDIKKALGQESPKLSSSKKEKPTKKSKK
ncbi:hypothetical protein RFI_30308, partial [Reticulomyxa filosa]